MNAFDLVASTPWLITEDALAGILEIAELTKDERSDRIDALEAKLGQPLQHTHAVTIREGVATIPIEGPIFRYANLMTQLSGATSTAEIATDLRSALDSSQVRAIILAIDSPGGEAAGVSELAASIHAARGIKPIIAYVGDLGCSAAYWIAAACDEIVASDTALLGSIGVVMTVNTPGTSGRSVEFVSSQSPNKRVDPTTDAGRAEIQHTVDALAQVFVESVASYRGASAEEVQTDFGRGGVLVGQHAVDAGLADRLQTYESLHEHLATAQTHGSMTRALSSTSLTERSNLPRQEQHLMTTTETQTSIPEDELEPTPEHQEDTVQAAAGELVTPASSEEVESLRAQLATMQETMDLESKRAAEAAAELARVQAEGEHRQRLATAAGWFGDPEKHAQILSQLSGDDLTFYIQTQKAHMEQLRASAVLQASGSSNPDPAMSALDRLNQLAAAKRSADPKLTKAKAFALATKENPDLYAEVEAGR